MSTPVLDLPLDADTMLARLQPWVECESPTFDAAAVERMLGLAARDLALLGATVERIPGRMGFAGCVRATFPHASTEPGVLVMGHMDTVHPIGTLGALPWRRDGDRQYGPGGYDMKAGNLIALEAIRALAAAGIATSRRVTVLFTPDEEVGSPSTRDLIEAEAARHAVVLVPEPARPDGGLVTGRYAIARFNLRTIGRPSHAGARLADGRSAIREMCRQVVAIEAMTSDSATYSVGVIQGGQWVNCVATFCDAESLSMAKRQADLDHAVERMLALRPSTDDVQLVVTRGVTRPVWEPDARGMALYETARRIGRELGLELSSQSSGGGSDGNFTGAMGIPTLDGLGVQGAGGHTLEEHFLVSSLVPRAKLLAGLLQTV